MPTGYDEPGVGYDEPIGFNGNDTDVRVALFDAAYTTELAALTRTLRREWLDELNREGSGTFQIGLDDADVAVIDWDTIAAFSIGGAIRFAARVEQMPAATRARGENAEWLLTCSGRGILSVLDDAKLLPELGIGRISPDYRLFNFASTYYNDGAWGPAIERKLVTTAGDPYPDAPQKWPSVLNGAYWIAPQADSGTPPQPVGKWYARRNFTVTNEGDYRLFLSADDGYRAFLDGKEIGGETRAYLWGETKYHDLGVLDAGNHLIAFEVENIDRPDNEATNISSLIFGIVEMAAGGTGFGDVVVFSDDATNVLPYPGDEPGMTPGDVILIPIQEEQLLGGLPGVTWDFDVILDSDDDPWPLVNVGFPVGTSLLDIVKAMIETSVDVRMGPDSLTLHAWIKPHGTDLSATVRLVPGTDGDPDTNLGELTHDSQGPKMTVGLARLADGRWYQREDAAAVAAWGRRVQYLELGTAQTVGQADLVIDTKIGELGGPSTHYRAQVEDTGLAAVPYVDYQTGDTIAVPDRDLVDQDERVAAIAVAEDVNAQPIYKVEL